MEMKRLRKSRFTRIVAVLVISILVIAIDSIAGDITRVTFSSIDLKQRKAPLFIGRENVSILQFNLKSKNQKSQLQSLEIIYSDDSHLEFLDSVKIFVVNNNDAESKRELFAYSTSGHRKFTSFIKMRNGSQNYQYQFDFVVKQDARLEQSFCINSVLLTFSNNKTIELKPEDSFRYRPAQVLRAIGQDGCQAYRIPGIVTTSRGTLIAVYDNRYNNSKDLQEDIDIGMSRSTDNGQSWEPMQVIMDMGEYGGLPQRLNGIGDPGILFDPFTNTLWAAAVWMSGSSHEKALWWESQPGMLPNETGQFILVKSTDDGLSWSDPINITEQIKDPKWQLLLAGPGCGISLDDGTLVFPAQYKADIGKQAIDGGKYTPFSTIIYSKDQGKTWTIGEGARSNTTEAQVVQLENGSLMLNMRDDRNRADKSESNGRAVSVTNDLGKTWYKHPSSNSALPEPNCMASLIYYKPDSGKGSRLLFSNPANKENRTHLSIKVSCDEGLTWPEKLHILLNEDYGFGYSCLTVTKDKCIGILYEGNSELFFQKIPLSETEL